MSNKMLIDASHQGEVRVVVTRNNRVEEFDFESEHKKQLKGNIYLAKVTRVEPALQAAFVEFSDGRSGFLAFSEIHPDYYQIPIADRLALLEAEEYTHGVRTEFVIEQIEENSFTQENKYETRIDKVDIDLKTVKETEDVKSLDIETISVEDISEGYPQHRIFQKKYKIQEVIKKRQVLLVQVMKEERNNKGAALTTYLSLAGRYSVLMPNTARGGGISRKITNIEDRKRLKEILDELEISKGMGIILRTAGASQTKTEIKRDYEYLIRLWESIRELTLKSVAPTMVYEEGNLIKRSIRDLYNKDIHEIFVSGEKAYREAKNFMHMLIPDHSNVVQLYQDKLPIFARNGIEEQLDCMLHPEVSLKSGGYIVINQTEALVSIDVNSGRATREHTIEETALQTNLEAAEEVARQLRLRDLAGLVVIDFIDMTDKRNIRFIEKKLREYLKEDRARIQIGRISSFGLMEMSRQRIRSSVLESIMQPCLHCNGSGYIRSDSSLALHTLRAVEEYLLHHTGRSIVVRVPLRTAFYILNRKRRVLSKLEDRFGLSIELEACSTLGDQPLSIHQGEEFSHTTSYSIGLSSPTSFSTMVQDDNTVPIEEDLLLPSDVSNKKVIVEPKYNRKTIDNAEASNLIDEDRKKRKRGRRGGRRHRESEFDNRILKQAELINSVTTESSTVEKRVHSPSDFDAVSNNHLDIISNKTIVKTIQKEEEGSTNLSKKKKILKRVNKDSQTTILENHEQVGAYTNMQTTTSFPIEEVFSEKLKKKDSSGLKAKLTQNTEVNLYENVNNSNKKLKRSQQLPQANLIKEPMQKKNKASKDVFDSCLNNKLKEKNPDKKRNLKLVKSIVKTKTSLQKKKKVKSDDIILEEENKNDVLPISIGENSVTVVNAEITEKKVFSSSNKMEGEGPLKVKKIGWWQRKGFFTT